MKLITTPEAVAEMHEMVAGTLRIESGHGLRTMDAHTEGREAYHRGDGPEMNPYDDRDAQFDEWEDGWCSARREDRTGGA